MKTKSVLLLILTLFLFKVYSQDNQDWKFMHPKPQPNNLRKIKMIDANTWFAAGASGTFMLTTNGGLNWSFHHFAGKVGPALDVSQAYDLWFFNASTGFVAGDKGYIGKTINGGVSFDSLALGLVPTSQRCQSIWFADQNTGYVAAGSPSGYGGTIIKTTNSGSSWASVYSTSNSAVSSLFGTDANIVYAVLVSGSILKTTNAGQNWTESANVIPIYMYDIAFLNSTTGFVAGGGGLLKRTTNAGTSWDSIPSPQTNWSYFQVKIFSASEIYLVGDPSFLYKSTDIGNTWNQIPISVPEVSTTYIWYSLDKSGSTYVLSGDYGIIAKSTNGGSTWSSNNYQLSTQLMFDIQTIPGTSKVWTVGRPYSGTTREVFYSSNGGFNWITYDLGVAGDFFAITMLNEQTGYVSGQNSRVLKTTNGGQNWTSMTNASGSNYSLYAMEFVNENTGWAFVNYSTVAAGNVFKTTNGGLNWSQYMLAATNPGGIMSCDMVDANTGYVTINGSNKPVYKTTDGGENWLPLTTGLTGIIYEVKAVDANNIYVVTSSGTSRVAKSTNGGANWTAITVPVAADFKSIDFKDANTGFICGNLTTAICRTTDGGATWSFQNAHVPTLGKVYVNSGDTAYALGAYTSILKAIGSLITGIHYNGNKIPEGYELKQNYPNPFNPKTTIQFSIPEQGNVALKIFDIQGREYVTGINNIQLNPGTFSFSFDGTNLSSGIYFCSLIVNNKMVSTKKMILNK